MARVLGAVLILTAAMTAQARASGPELVSATLEMRQAGGFDLVVEARDPDAALNGVTVASPDLRDHFGESGCLAAIDGGAPPAAGPLSPGRTVRFRVPVEPLGLRAPDITLTLTSGACGPHQRKTTHRVSLALPRFPLPVLGGRAHARAASSAATCPDSDLMPERFVLPRVRAATVCLINRERARAGVVALKTSKQLRRAARRHAIDMLQRRYFEHKRAGGPNFAERIRAAGYIAVTAGENIGYGTGHLATPREMIEAWMNSPPHRHNMLDPDYRAVGIAVAIPASVVPHEPGATYTVNFAKRR